MFKTNFSGHNKLCEALPPNARRGHGLGPDSRVTLDSLSFAN